MNRQLNPTESQYHQQISTSKNYFMDHLRYKIKSFKIKAEFKVKQLYPSLGLCCCRKFLIWLRNRRVIDSIVAFWQISAERLFSLIPSCMARLNSEDFSKFFLCLDILFLAYSPESTHLVVHKTAETISNLLEYSWFFRLFRGFSYKNFQTQWDPNTCYISKESP